MPHPPCSPDLAPWLNDYIKNRLPDQPDEKCLARAVSKIVRNTVATKIIQQTVTLFFPTLYLLYSKSYASRVFIYLYHKVSSICMISFSSIDQTVHFLLKKKIITYNLSPSKIIQQVTFWDRK